jgi:hypothetical protein
VSLPFFFQLTIEKAHLFFTTDKNSFCRRRFRHGQILGGYNLPLAVTSNPRVGPDESAVAWFAFALFPRLTALRHGGIAKEPDFNSIKVV